MSTTAPTNNKDVKSSSIANAAIQKKRRRASPKMVESQNHFIAEKMNLWKGTLKACCEKYAPELNEPADRVYQRYLKWCKRTKSVLDTSSLITLSPEDEQAVVIFMMKRKLPPYTKNILNALEELNFVKGAGANNTSWSGWCSRFAERWRQFLGRVPDRYKYRSETQAEPTKTTTANDDDSASDSESSSSSSSTCSSCGDSEEVDDDCSEDSLPAR